MQEELVVAKRAAVGGDRLGAVWHAHQSLEEDLASFQAALTLVKKGQQSIGSFDPATELAASVRKVDRDAVVCMRLFTARREMASTKGMATVEALYKRGTSASARLTAFAAALRAVLGGSLPPAPAFAIGLSLRKVDSRATKSFLSEYIDAYVRHLKCANDEEKKDAVSAAVMGSAADGQQLLPALLRLDVECCSTSDTGADTQSAFARHRGALDGLLSSSTMAELDAYETRFRAEHPRQCARLQERRQKEQETQVALAKQQRARCSKQSAAVNSTASATNALAPAMTSASRTLLQVLMNPLNVSGWRLNTSRAVLIMVALFLVRLLASHSMTLLGRLRNLTRSSPSQARRRTLSL